LLRKVLIALNGGVFYLSMTFDHPKKSNPPKFTKMYKAVFAQVAVDRIYAKLNAS
jgi:hypothetical protein